MNKLELIKPIRGYLHVIFDSEHFFGVTRGFNIEFDYYDRAEDVRNKKELLKVVKSINKKSKEFGYRIDLVKQTIKAIEGMRHHLYRVLWSSKYIIPLVIETVARFEYERYYWLVVPYRKTGGDSDE